MATRPVVEMPCPWDNQWVETNSLSSRIDRIYAALSGTTETDLARFRPNCVDEDGRVVYWLDFRALRSVADSNNIAHSLVSNIAHIYDHLRKWVHRDETKLAMIEDLMRQRAFQVIKDLSDADKHGGERRDGGLSGVAPQLRDVHSTLRLRTKPEVGSSVAIVFTPGGPRQVGGSGTAAVVVTGEVVARDGTKLGDLLDIAEEAITIIEQLAEDLGLPLTSGPDA